MADTCPVIPTRTHGSRQLLHGEGFNDLPDSHDTFSGSHICGETAAVSLYPRALVGKNPTRENQRFVSLSE